MPTLRDLSLLRSHCLIAGEWHAFPALPRLCVRNPATREALAEVPNAGAVETEQAIAAAAHAFPAWRQTTAQQRARILRRWYELILTHQEDLAQLMTAEQGKPLAEARGEIGYAASFLEWFGEEAKRAYGELIPSPLPERRLAVLREPIGVCAAITPWNFPAAMITRKLAPALAAGCTMVLKPAEQTPLSALALAELGIRAGVPPGVLNVITGNPAPIGAALCASPTVRKLSFTGSTEVGRLLMNQCSGTLKRLSLELGGNAPFIVFDDADLEAAVQGAIASKFRNSGQTCICSNRFLVQDGIHDRFAGALAQAVAGLVSGVGTDSLVHQGPLIDATALAKVEYLVTDALALGAKLLVGGQRHALGGTWFEPTVLVEVTPAMALYQQEIFGPIAPLMRFGTEQEAIRLANDTEYGLAAYLYTRDHCRVWRISEALEYGMVGVNSGLISNEVAPFGGVKQSGFGREGSRHGLDEYQQLKYVALSGL